MAEQNAHVAAPESDQQETNQSDTSKSFSFATALSSGISRLVKGTGIRRPSKIPRLGKQTSVSSIAEISTTMSSKALSVASGVSSRETTPFNSPQKPSSSSRLREPSKFVSRKRPREEISASLQEAVDRIDRRAETLSAAGSSRTTQDDAASLSSSRGFHRRGEEDENDESESLYDNDTRSVRSERLGGDGDYDDEQQQQQCPEQVLAVGRALRKDLSRDRARQRLKISTMKEDVEQYYELLARMEQVAAAAKARILASATQPSEEQDVNTLRLVDRILEIISARQPTQSHESTVVDVLQVGIGEVAGADKEEEEEVEER